MSSNLSTLDGCRELNSYAMKWGWDLNIWDTLGFDLMTMEHGVEQFISKKRQQSRHPNFSCLWLWKNIQTGRELLYEWIQSLDWIFMVRYKVWKDKVWYGKVMVRSEAGVGRWAVRGGGVWLQSWDWIVMVKYGKIRYGKVMVKSGAGVGCWAVSLGGVWLQTGLLW